MSFNQFFEAGTMAYILLSSGVASVSFVALTKILKEYPMEIFFQYLVVLT